MTASFKPVISIAQRSAGSCMLAGSCIVEGLSGVVGTTVSASLVSARARECHVSHARQNHSHRLTLTKLLGIATISAARPRVSSKSCLSSSSVAAAWCSIASNFSFKDAVICSNSTIRASPLLLLRVLLGLGTIVGQ